MTHYPGGKRKIGHDISIIIHQFVVQFEEQIHHKFNGYCEPFCGMLGVYQHIPDLFCHHKPPLKYLAGDRN